MVVIRKRKRMSSVDSRCNEQYMCAGSTVTSMPSLSDQFNSSYSFSRSLVVDGYPSVRLECTRLPTPADDRHHQKFGTNT
jgi:hypothetical protein